jgi:WD repeat-containing protein 89
MQLDETTTIAPYILRCQTQHLNDKHSVNRGIYIFEIVLSTRTNGRTPDSFAVASSTYDVQIYDVDQLRWKQSLKGHTDGISRIRYANSNPNFLWSSSLDGTIRLWDLRNPKPAQSYSSHSATPERYTTFDVNNNESAIIAGTELSGDMERSGRIELWDIRSPKSMATLTEAHTDDVTQIVCHPSLSSYFLSGSLDYLMCFCDMNDLMNEDRDFGILTTINTQQPVTKLGFCDQACHQVYVTSHVESFSIWDFEETCKIMDLGDVRGNRWKPSIAAIDYIVDCMYDWRTQQLFLIGGTYRYD